MDIKKVQKQLLSISTIVNSLLAEAQETIPSQESQESRTICPICDRNLHDGTTLQRGVHQRCYKRSSRENRIEELENSGVLLPPQRGRKKEIDMDLVIKRAKDGKNKSNGNTKKK